MAIFLLADNTNQAPEIKAPTLLVRLIRLFDREASGIIHFSGKKLKLGSSLTKKTEKWKSTIPKEKIVIDLANSINT